MEKINLHSQTCPQKIKVQTPPEQLAKNLRTLETTHWYLHIPGVTQIVDWDGQKRKEYVEKQNLLKHQIVEKPCPVIKVEKKLEKETELKQKIVKPVEAPIVTKEPKLKTRKTPVKPVKKNRSSKGRTSSVPNKKPPVASKPIAVIKEEPKYTDPEKKLAAFKTYFYQYKSDLHKQKEIDQKWQALAKEMSSHRGLPVYEEFIKFSAAMVEYRKRK